MMVPLAHSACGDARYSTAAAISLARATRPKGLCARISSPAGPLRCRAAMAVSTKPGATVATAIPCGASARASDWPNAFSPALLAPEGAAGGDVDDAPAAVGDHVLDRAPGHVRRPGEVDGERRLPGLLPLLIGGA